MSLHKHACEICGKGILEQERAVKIEVGKRGRTPIFGYWSGGKRGGAVAHRDCLEMEETDLKEDKEIQSCQLARKALFKLAEVELVEKED